MSDMFKIGTTGMKCPRCNEKYEVFHIHMIVVIMRCPNCLQPYVFLRDDLLRGEKHENKGGNMKQKKIGKKISLNKVTVANLQEDKSGDHSPTDD